MRFFLLFFCLILSLPLPLHAAPVMTGAQVLAADNFQLLRGKRFGLITNASATVDGEHLVDIFSRNGVPPAVIFTPEHGLAGAAEDGKRVDDGSVQGIAVKSLYGASKKPNPADLKGLDLLVFDIQDVGVRFYTYISTMGLAMVGAAEAGIPFVVLDRPNPLGGLYVSGFVRTGIHPSFTALYPIPIAHGMTVGELAQMIKGEKMLAGVAGLDLTVVRMQGWQRSMRWPDTGLSFQATSPNIANFDACLLYPGTGLLEGTEASAGRGTAEPFQLVGLPGVDAQALAQKLDSLELPGVRFEPVHFTPQSMPGKASSPRYCNRDVSGVRIEVTDYERMEPVETGVAVLYELWNALSPEQRKSFLRKGFDDMAGTALLRRAIVQGDSPQALCKLWSSGVSEFRKMREPYLIYQ